MLRISTLKSASDYYTKSLTKGDYYSEQSEISGEWQGLGAKKLGVFGEIKKEQFDLLCAGHHPLTGDQLSSRIVSDRREAYDFTFSVPKSVSVLSAVSTPEVASLIQDQIKESMNFTMNEVERNIQTRIRESGKNDNRVTSNIVYGYFLHKNARPIDGYSDPHLHIHAVVMNLTFDNVDKKWKAIQMRDKKENASYYQSIFNSTLANRLQTIGLGIAKTNINFEVTGITDQTIKTFSRRTDEIEKEALAQNIHSVDAKGKLGARTRQSKSDKHSQSELQDIFQNLLSPDQKIITQSLSSVLQSKIDGNQIDYKVLDQNLVSKSDKSENESQTKKWLDYTLEHHFERHSTSSEQRLIDEVLKNGIGQTNLELVTKQLEQYKKKGILINELTSDKVDLGSIKARNNLSPSITTQVALAEEQSIIATINSQMIMYRPVNSEFANTILQDQFLSQNQRETVSKILKSSDGVTLLEGKAGTGKTTTLKAINKGLQQANYTVTVLAPTTKAVEVLQSEGFVNAMTVQKYLVGDTASKDQTVNQNYLNYLIVDEASLVSVRQMDKLLKLTTKNSQRVLLVGDTKQHKSVERGNTLKVIQTHSQIQTHSLYKIQRQTSSEAKLAVQDLSNGNTIDGIEKFERLGFVHEIKDDNQRLAKVAQIYVDNLPKVYVNKVSKVNVKTQKVENAAETSNQNSNHKDEQPKQNFLSRLFGGNKNTQEISNNQNQSETKTETKSKITSDKIEYPRLNPQAPTLVITPTHKDGLLLHDSIRNQLKKGGLIDSQDYTIDTLRSLGWTVAQKAEISNYHPGQILQFSRNISQFKRGDRYEVVEKNKGQQKDEQKQIEPQIQLQVQIQNIRTKEIKDLPIQSSTYFDTYQKITLQFSKGDLIQSQSCGVVKDPQNLDKERQLTNGAIYQIRSISPKTGDITLTNNWILPKDFGNLKSAYYSTSQASQGQTATHSVFYTSNQSLHLLNQEMVYVANSRFKQANTILTPDLQEFKQQASKGEMKSLAIEVTLPKQLNKPAPYTPSFKPTIEKGLSKTKGMKR
jgi:conjugative relaxase-like TrwC/TraI family protein